MGSLIVNNLGKAYRAYPSPGRRLLEWLWPKKARHELHWVLRHLSFHIMPGECVGIIGRNGAGKSTLLKMITGTTQPTEGEVRTEGRIAALLELGMGFHPEFTGAQNALMAGQLLGFTEQEVNQAMAEIRNFAEIGDYFDQPVRTYSSGMQVRLGFAVATAIRPDILIVDEALAVGDAYFQHKCYERIRAFREAGTTLLFVSHDPSAIRSLCNRAILIEAGRVVLDGLPDRVLDYYNAMMTGEVKPQIQQNDGETRSGSREAEVLQVSACNAQGAPTQLFISGEAARIQIDWVKHQPLPGLTMGFLLRDRLGNDVFGTNTYLMDANLDHVPVGEPYRLVFELPSLALGSGSYSITVALHARTTHMLGNYDWWDRAAIIEVVPDTSFSFAGVARLAVHHQVEKLPA